MSDEQSPASRPAVLAAAARYREGFSPAADSTPVPRRHLVVVTCMDARLDLFRLLGLEVGDSHLLRNAGGRVTDDVIRSLVLSSHLLGTREALVIHHTGCGLHGLANEQVHGQVAASTGADATDIDFLPFADVADSVLEDVAAVRACGLLPEGFAVWGAVYDVADGSLTPVT